MNCRLELCLLVAVAMMVACTAEASIMELRNKYRNLVNHERGFGPAGGRGSAAAAAAAGSGGVSSSVAASAAAAGFGYQGGHPQGPYVAQPKYYRQPPVHQHHYPSQPMVFMSPPAPPPPPRVSRHQPMRHSNAHYGDLMPEQSVPRFHNTPQFRTHYEYPRQQHQHYQYYPEPRYVKSNHGQFFQPGAATSSAAATSAGGGAGGAAATSSGASGGSMRGAAAAASASAGGQHYAPDHNHHTLDREEMSEHYHQPESVNHFEAQSGTFADGKGGEFEHGSYVRETESAESHEDGREDGDHYYNAQAYGKSGDVNNHMAYNNKDEDLIHTPNLFRKKKSKTNFVSNYNKQHRETGSGVVAHDKHSAMFNKNSKKLKENVDQHYAKGSEGAMKTKAYNSHSDIDDEDEMETDTRGLGNFVGVDGVVHGKRRQFNNHGAAAAAAAASGAASASVQGDHLKAQ